MVVFFEICLDHTHKNFLFIDVINIIYVELAQNSSNTQLQVVAWLQKQSQYHESHYYFYYHLEIPLLVAFHSFLGVICFGLNSLDIVIAKVEICYYDLGVKKFYCYYFVACNGLNGCNNKVDKIKKHLLSVYVKYRTYNRRCFGD